MLHRAHDRALARKAHAARLRFFHERRNTLPRFAGGVWIDAVYAKHHGRIEQIAFRIANLGWRAGKMRQIAVARAVDEHLGAYRHAAGFRLDQDGDDAVVLDDRAGGERVEQHIHLAGGEQIVGGTFIGRGIVGLRLGLAEDQMWFVEPAERVDPRQQFVGDAVHDLANVAVHIGVQAAEIRHARGRAHAAEKTVALNQQRFARERASRGGGRAGSVMLDNQRRSWLNSLYSGCATPSTTSKLRRKPASRQASACAYSGERYHLRAVSRSGNSAITSMRGDQVPSSTSIAPPRTR